MNDSAQSRAQARVVQLEGQVAALASLAWSILAVLDATIQFLPLHRRTKEALHRERDFLRKGLKKVYPTTPLFLVSSGGVVIPESTTGWPYEGGAYYQATVSIKRDRPAPVLVPLPGKQQP